jgi:hypothetical protein
MRLLFLRFLRREVTSPEFCVFRLATLLPLFNALRSSPSYSPDGILRSRGNVVDGLLCDRRLLCRDVSGQRAYRFSSSGGLSPTQQSSGKEQQGFDECEHGAKRDPNQAQWQRKQPHDGKETQRQDRKRPAQHKQDAPTHKHDQSFHASAGCRLSLERATGIRVQDFHGRAQIVLQRPVPVYCS